MLKKRPFLNGFLIWINVAYTFEYPMYTILLSFYYLLGPSHLKTSLLVRDGFPGLSNAILSSNPNMHADMTINMPNVKIQSL